MATPNPAPAAAPLTIENASQARSLDDLAAIGAGMEAPAGAAPGGPPPAGGAVAAGMPNPLAVANGQVLLDTVRALRDGFCFFTKANAPRAIATDSALRELAGGWGDWTAKRGYDLKTLFGDHADTLPLALSTCALAWAVVHATKAELAARKPVEATDKAQAAPPEPAAPPAGDTTATFPGQGGAS